jgi:hypothetical protein
MYVSDPVGSTGNHSGAIQFFDTEYGLPSKQLYMQIFECEQQQYFDVLLYVPTIDYSVSKRSNIFIRQKRSRYILRIANR